LIRSSNWAAFVPRCLRVVSSILPNPTALRFSPNSEVGTTEGNKENEAGRDSHTPSLETNRSGRCPASAGPSFASLASVCSASEIGFQVRLEMPLRRSA
jgi:hypothetical protein